MTVLLLWSVLVCQTLVYVYVRDFSIHNCEVPKSLRSNQTLTDAFCYYRTVDRTIFAEPTSISMYLVLAFKWILNQSFIKWFLAQAFKSHSSFVILPLSAKLLVHMGDNKCPPMFVLAYLILVLNGHVITTVEARSNVRNSNIPKHISFRNHVDV